MKTKLEHYIESNFLDETAVMNHLQDHGIISDECVWAKDVALVDQIPAIAFLEMTKDQYWPTII